MDEMNVEPVDPRQELRKRVQLALCPAPIVGGLPILREFTKLLLLDALGPIRDGRAIRPTCCGQAPSEVDERTFGDVGLEGLDGIALRRLFTMSAATPVTGSTAADTPIAAPRNRNERRVTCPLVLFSRFISETPVRSLRKRIGEIRAGS